MQIECQFMQAGYHSTFTSKMPEAELPEVDPNIAAMNSL